MNFANEIFDVVIIGSGASAISSVIACVKNGIKPLVVDVGYTPYKSQYTASTNIYDIRKKSNSLNMQLGENFESLEYMVSDDNLKPAKLRSSNSIYVTKLPQEFLYEQSNFYLNQSFSYGGLCNSWGGGLTKFSDTDLKDLPINLNELQEYYDLLEDYIDICSTNDDMTDFLGKFSNTNKSLNLSENANRIFKSYIKKRTKLNSSSFVMGRPVLAVNSNMVDCLYNNMEFWLGKVDHIFSPSKLFDKFISENKVLYKSNSFVERWINNDDQTVSLVIRDTLSNQLYKIKSKKLIIGAGVVSTANIVLKSRNDYTSVLSLNDNPAIQIPLILYKTLGSKFQKKTFGLTQLQYKYKSIHIDDNVLGAILEITSPLRSEFIDKFPLDVKSNLFFVKYFLPSLMVSQVFFPSNIFKPANISLDRNGSLNIKSINQSISKSLIKELSTYLSKLGVLALPQLAVNVVQGNSIHYSGTFPMSNEVSNKNATSKYGKLNGVDNVYIVDGSVINSIPSKNYTYTVMANSLRIADHLCKQIIDEKYIDNRN